MNRKIFPPDQSRVLFQDKEGVSREGIYVLSLNAYVEAIGDEGPEDGSNIYPDRDIVYWEYLEDSEMGGGFIEAF